MTRRSCFLIPTFGGWNWNSENVLLSANSCEARSGVDTVKMTSHVADGAELHYHLIVLNINSTSDHLSEHCADCAAGWPGLGVQKLSLPLLCRAVGCSQERLFWSELCGSRVGRAGGSGRTTRKDDTSQRCEVRPGSRKTLHLPAKSVK